MTLINTVGLPLSAKKIKCHSRESNSRTGAYNIDVLPTVLTAKLHRRIIMAILLGYDMSARHEEPKRKMFGASGGGDVGQLTFYNVSVGIFAPSLLQMRQRNEYASPLGSLFPGPVNYNHCTSSHEQRLCSCNRQVLALYGEYILCSGRV